MPVGVGPDGMALPPLPPGIAAPVPEAPPTPSASECNDLEFNLENVDKVGAWGVLRRQRRVAVRRFSTFVLSHLPMVRYCMYQPRSFLALLGELRLLTKLAYSLRFFRC